jgi:hypothetical protein
VPTHTKGRHIAKAKVRWWQMVFDGYSTSGHFGVVVQIDDLGRRCSWIHSSPLWLLVLIAISAMQWAAKGTT